MKIEFNKRELASVKPADFGEVKTIYITDKFGAAIYQVYLDGLKSTVFSYNANKDLNCTPGTRGGWPYYIADFLYRR
jgi:hypothetical protein